MEPEAHLKVIHTAPFIFTDYERDGYGHTTPFEATAYTFTYSDGSVWTWKPANNRRDESWKLIRAADKANQSKWIKFGSLPPVNLDLVFSYEVTNSLIKFRTQTSEVNWEIKEDFVFLNFVQEVDQFLENVTKGTQRESCLKNYLEVLNKTIFDKNVYDFLSKFVDDVNSRMKRDDFFKNCFDGYHEGFFVTSRKNNCFVLSCASALQKDDLRRALWEMLIPAIDKEFAGRIKITVDFDNCAEIETTYCAYYFPFELNKELLSEDFKFKKLQ